MRFFFHIGFSGFDYHGWQRQSQAPSVQQVIEDAMSQILKEPVTIMGCGRTDAMVHASQFFFHFECREKWDFDLLFRLNKILPDDIAVFEIIPVEDNQHARFDATARTYDYFIHTYKDPFLHELSAYYPEQNLDLDKIKQATALLTQYDDYYAFCKTPEANQHTRCNISSAQWFTNAAGDRLRFEITSDRFLARMVRTIVVRLLDVGKGTLSIDKFESYLVTKRGPQLMETAYPQGLYLSRVVYPYLDIPSRPEFIRALKIDEVGLSIQ